MIVSSLIWRFFFSDFVLGGTGHGGEREKARFLQEDEKKRVVVQLKGLLVSLRCVKVFCCNQVGVTIQEKYSCFFL